MLRIYLIGSFVLTASFIASVVLFSPVAPESNSLKGGEISTGQAGPHLNEVQLPARLQSAREPSGSPVRGRELFLLSDLECRSCHSIELHEESLGPNLFAVGDRLNSQQITDSILTPSKDLAAGYKSLHVLLADGHQVSGIEVEEESANTVLVLVERDVRQVIDRNDIDHIAVAASDMPNGLCDQLAEQDFADLIAFLTSLRGRSP